MKKYGYILMTGLLVMVMVSFSTLTVMGKQKKDAQINDAYHAGLKKEYVGMLREKMDELGYKNAGITMCETVDENGERTYTVSIHHKRIDKMDASAQADFLEELQTVSLGDKECKVIQKILRYNM